MPPPPGYRKNAKGGYERSGEDEDGGGSDGYGGFSHGDDGASDDPWVPTKRASEAELRRLDSKLENVKKMSKNTPEEGLTFIKGIRRACRLASDEAAAIFASCGSPNAATSRCSRIPRQEKK
jgi:hypothetical protein